MAPSQSLAHWEGPKLIIVSIAPSGTAVQMIISFSPDGRTCDVKSMFGTPNGQTVRTRVSGMVFDPAYPTSLSNVSCTIRPGNAFAGE